MSVDHRPYTCGGCGSRELTFTQLDGCLYGQCDDCNRFQEVETRPDTARQLCDNCAFRPGSDERRDPYLWAALRERAAEGEPFYCHKGIAARLDGGSLKYDLPAIEADRKPCAGWLAHHKAALARECPDA